MFTVIYFLKSEEVEVVSSHWVVENERGSDCYWPPYQKSSAIIKAVQKHEPPDKKSWKPYPVRCLYKTGIWNFYHYD
jgi:hypothetical protein